MCECIVRDSSCPAHGVSSCCLCVFFFSSRRRHTRCLSDWSSDVCSSDLSQGGRLPRHAVVERHDQDHARVTSSASDRSEERRVGKEWRSRWWPYHEKKKGVTIEARQMIIMNDDSLYAHMVRHRHMVREYQ